MDWYDGSWLESGVNAVSDWWGGGGQQAAPEVISVGRVPLGGGDTTTANTGSWLDRNSDWLKPLAQFGLGAYAQNNRDNAQGAYLDYLRQKEMGNFDAARAAAEAYNAQLAAAGGGGGGGNGAAAAAARATEANRRKAAKKASKKLQSTYKEILGMYAPLKATTERLLPQKTAAYESSLGIQNLLAGFVQKPEQMKKLEENTPAWMVNVPLPDMVRLK